MILAAVFLLALAPRVVYLLGWAPTFSGDYWDLSTSLLRNGTLALEGFKTTRYEPLYPLFIAAARRLAGGEPIGIQFLQVVVASLGAVWLYLTAKWLTGNSRVAFLASALYAFHPLLVRHAVDQSDSALLTMLLILFVFLAVRATTLAQAAAAGVAVGLAIMTRSMVLPLVLLTAIVLLARRRGSLAIVFTMASIAVMTPMLARNYLTAGSAVPSRNGANLFIGNSAYTAALLPAYSPDILGAYANSLVARELPGLTPGTLEFADAADPILSRLAWAEIRDHPLATLALKARNVVYIFSPFLIPSHRLTPDTSVLLTPGGGATVENSPLRPFSERLVFAVTSLLVLAGAAAGIVVRRHELLRRDATLWAVLLTFVAIYSVYFPATRYSAPVVFVLLFYAAVAIDRAVTKGRLSIDRPSRAGSARSLRSAEGRATSQPASGSR